jgi:putative DNA primase/helicase
MSTQTLIEAMRDAGVDPGSMPLVPDGVLRRYRGPGDKRGQKNCWYTLYDHGGAFGSWRLGLNQTWSNGANHKLTRDQRQKLKADIKAAQAKAETEQKQIHETAAAKARRLYDSARPLAQADHPYLVRKNVQPHGIRQLGPSLVIPLHDVVTDELVSLQFIRPDGNKRFLHGGRTGGCCLSIGELPEGGPEQIAVGEGFATAASIHESAKSSVHLLVVAAFNAGNLLAVAKALRQKYRAATILLCADDDRRTPGNPGLTISAL